jgi:hypothetical protein
MVARVAWPAYYVFLLVDSEQPAVDPLIGSGHIAEDPCQLLCGHGVGAICRQQGTQGSEQAPPALQYLQDRFVSQLGNSATCF